MKSDLSRVAIHVMYDSITLHHGSDLALFTAHSLVIWKDMAGGFWNRNGGPWGLWREQAWKVNSDQLFPWYPHSPRNHFFFWDVSCNLRGLRSFSCLGINPTNGFNPRRLPKCSPWECFFVSSYPGFLNHKVSFSSAWKVSPSSPTQELCLWYEERAGP